VLSLVGASWDIPVHVDNRIHEDVPHLVISEKIIFHLEDDKYLPVGVVAADLPDPNWQRMVHARPFPELIPEGPIVGNVGGPVHCVPTKVALANLHRQTTTPVEPDPIPAVEQPGIDVVDPDPVVNPPVTTPAEPDESVTDGVITPVTPTKPESLSSKMGREARKGKKKPTQPDVPQDGGYHKPARPNDKQPTEPDTEVGTGFRKPARRGDKKYPTAHRHGDNTKPVNEPGTLEGGIVQPLKVGDWCSADGPYLNTKGEVKNLAYLEIVEVKVAANMSGEVFVQGIDSRNKNWIFASSLTPITPPAAHYKFN
jgi:hypothetical protein